MYFLQSHIRQSSKNWLIILLTPTLLLMSQVVACFTLLCYGMMLQTSWFPEKPFDAEDTTLVAKAGHARFKVSSFLWGEMLSACGFERVPPVGEIILTEWRCGSPWTTIMAATARHQNMVAVKRCSSVEDAGKWHLWETLPPALSTCVL